MIQKYKRLIAFWFKALEFRYNTWKRQKEIDRAYQEHTYSEAVFNFFIKNLKVILYITLIIFLGIIFFTTAPVIINSSKNFIKSLQSAKKERKKTTPLKITKKQENKNVEIKMPDSKIITKEGNTSFVPESFEGEIQYCILANKASRSLLFIERDSATNGWKIIKKYNVIMGKNGGPKQTAGDGRTPEGIYFIIGRKEGWDLNTIYGPLAYVLNYPNEEDKIAGRTGNGIWIHGMPEDSSRIQTRGCLVMDNKNLIELSHYLKIGIGTPVIIINDSNFVNVDNYFNYLAIKQKRNKVLEEYKKQEKEFVSILNQWKKAWETKNLKEYESFYDKERFISGGISWNSWIDKKARTFEMYDTININIDKIKVVDFSETTAVVVFLQQYISNLNQKQNAKKISFFKKSGKWLIIREETFSNQEFFL